jgi:hypothetical protein
MGSITMNMAVKAAIRAGRSVMSETSGCLRREYIQPNEGAAA